MRIQPPQSFPVVHEWLEPKGSDPAATSQSLINCAFWRFVLIESRGRSQIFTLQRTFHGKEDSIWREYSSFFLHHTWSQCQRELQNIVFYPLELLLLLEFSSLLFTPMPRFPCVLALSY